MITKFRCLYQEDVVLEVERSDHKEITVIVEDQSRKTLNSIILSEQDLFNLIGQLLRLQSEIKKGGNNE